MCTRQTLAMQIIYTSRRNCHEKPNAPLAKQLLQLRPRLSYPELIRSFCSSLQMAGNPDMAHDDYVFDYAS